MITPHHVKEIEKILSNGDRIELIPSKDGVTILRIRRDKIKIDSPSKMVDGKG